MLICRYCSSSFFNASVDVPAVLTGPSLTVTLTTGTCAIVKNQTKGDDKTNLLEDSLTCVGPELSYEKVCIHYVARHDVLHVHSLTDMAQVAAHLIMTAFSVNIALSFSVL